MLLAAPALVVADGEVPEPSRVRPGDPIGVPASCTLNFLFADASGAVFAGTAAHCVHAAGDVVANQQLGPFGKVDRIDRALDFALVRLDGGVAFDATMRGATAPQGVAGSSDLLTGDLLRTHGHGLGVGLAVQTRARDGVLVGKDDQRFWWDTVATPGDSGAPVVHLATGKAVGIVSKAGTAHAATDVGPRLDHVLRTMEGAAGLRLLLAGEKGVAPAGT